MAKGKVVSGTPITKKSYLNGNQGFNQRASTLGGDTQPGPGPGAPYSQAIQQTTSKAMVDRTGLNPFNAIEANAAGVLGPDVAKQNAGYYPDGPVPKNAPRAHPDLMSKESNSSAAETEIGNIPRGVLGRG